MKLAATLYLLLLQSYYSLMAVAASFHPKAKLFMEGRKAWPERFKDLNLHGRKVAWFHCASLGEFEQGRPLMEALKHSQPETFILLTFYSPSGYEIRKNYPGADLILYLPLDYPAEARNFIRLAKPSFAVFVKYEFWYFHLKELHRQGIPFYLIAGIFRPKQPFFKPYGVLHRQMLGFFRHFFVQDEPSFQLLRSLGVTDASLAGDPRFDRVLAVKESRKAIPMIEQFAAGGPLVVLGSVWPQDRKLFAPLLQQLPYRWVVVPHDIHEDELLEWEALFPGQAARFSTGNMPDAARLLLVDQVGLLSSIYAYARIAYVGGGLGAGLHNTLEAAVYGLPVLFGSKNYLKFREVVELQKLGAAIGVKTTDELRSTFEMLENEALYQELCHIAHTFVKNGGGVIERILPQILAWEYNGEES
jgi:3-deoxy-D-manno-octulosonic-acid transferase